MKPYILYYERKYYKGIVLFGSFLILIIIGILDYLTGTAFNFFIFYALPILIVVWYTGKILGVLFGLISVAFWFLDVYLERTVTPEFFFLFWEIIIRLVFLILLALLLNSLKVLLVKQKNAEKQKLLRDIQLAQKVQQNFFPISKPDFPGLDYEGICVPAEAVGGDYYDYLKISDSKIAFIIGDITGHGLAPALVMAGLAGFIRSNFISYKNNLKEIMSLVNNFLIKSTEKGTFASLFVGIYDSETHRFDFVNAGHNYPLILRGDTFRELKSSGIVSGVYPDFDYKPDSTTINENDLMILYTDGITEAFNSKSDMYETGRLKKVVFESRNKNSYGIINAILSDLEKFSGKKIQDDDSTIIAVKFQKLNM